MSNQYSNTVIARIFRRPVNEGAPDGVLRIDEFGVIDQDCVQSSSIADVCN